MAQSHHLFEITELVQLILLLLPMLDLARGRYVCKKWQSIIDQRATRENVFWFNAETAQKKLIWDLDQQSNDLRPVLVNSNEPRATDRGATVVKLHPLLEKLHLSFKRKHDFPTLEQATLLSTAANRRNNQTTLDLERLPSIVRYIDIVPLLRNTGTFWRNAFLTQPPIRKALIGCRIRDSELSTNERFFKYETTTKPGITFGDLIDEFKDSIQKRAPFDAYTVSLSGPSSHVIEGSVFEKCATDNDEWEMGLGRMCDWNYLPEGYGINPRTLNTLGRRIQTFSDRVFSKELEAFRIAREDDNEHGDQKFRECQWVTFEGKVVGATKRKEHERPRFTMLRSWQEF